MDLTLAETYRIVFTLIEEASRDIFHKGGYDFFERALENRLEVHHIYNDRMRHEFGHMICCRDENVNSPFWDYNWFIDRDGNFPPEIGWAEARVLLVGFLFDGQVGAMAVNLVVGRMAPGWSFDTNPTYIQGVNCQQLHQALEKMIQEPFFSPDNLLNEANRKLQLIRGGGK